MCEGSGRVWSMEMQKCKFCGFFFFFWLLDFPNDGKFNQLCKVINHLLRCCSSCFVWNLWTDQSPTCPTYQRIELWQTAGSISVSGLFRLPGMASAWSIPTIWLNWFIRLLAFHWPRTKRFISSPPTLPHNLLSPCNNQLSSTQSATWIFQQRQLDIKNALMFKTRLNLIL